jgi:flagellar hook assembly protein FlgD
MAQFTSLQQVSLLSTTVSQMSSSQQNLAASSYLGRVVTMNGSNSTKVSGPVTAVDLSGTTPTLQVNGTYYPLGSLVSVSAAAATSNTTTAN